LRSSCGKAIRAASIACRAPRSTSTEQRARQLGRRFEAEFERLLRFDFWDIRDYVLHIEDTLKMSVTLIDKRNCSVVGGRMELGFEHSTSQNV
jgi:hypothetical protein